MKMINLMKIIIYTYPMTKLAILTFLILVGCSSEPTIKSPAKTYSSSTEREFEMIEKNDLRVNPPYRSSVKPREKPAIVIKEKEVPVRENLLRIPPKTTVQSNTDTTQLSAKNQERLQEINQNLAFFCMKHRKDHAFLNEDQCLAFTKKVLKSCEKKHKLINTVMVNCIKDQLKKR